MAHLPIPSLNGPTKKRFLARVEKGVDCWLWKGAHNSCGRGTVTIQDKSYVAARVMYKLHYEIDPGLLKVCHTCDNPSCVNPEHLWLGSQADNMADCKKKGRQRRVVGGKNPRARLTLEQVAIIRASTEGSGKLAKQFNTTPSQIWRIRTGKRWRQTQ